MSRTLTRRPRPGCRRYGWERKYLGVCPRCGQEVRYRERQQGYTPNGSIGRVVRLTPREAYCGCQGAGPWPG